MDMEVDAQFFAKEDGIIAGITLAKMIFYQDDHSLKPEWSKKDGDTVHNELQFRKVSGKAHKIVVAERVVLNVMQANEWNSNVKEVWKTILLTRVWDSQCDDVTGPRRLYVFL